MNSEIKPKVIHIKHFKHCTKPVFLQGMRKTPNSSNKQMSALLQGTINSDRRKYPTLLTIFKMSMPSFWIQKGEAESLSWGNLAGKKRKIASISCLKISIFRFSGGTPHKIPKQRRKRKSWRKTSHTSQADFLHKPMQLQTLKAQIVEHPDGTNIRLRYHWLRTHFQ